MTSPVSYKCTIESMYPEVTFGAFTKQKSISLPYGVCPSIRRF